PPAPPDRATRHPPPQRGGGGPAKPVEGAATPPDDRHRCSSPRGLTSLHLPPCGAGLLHMSKEFEEEVFAPVCAAHFLCDGLVDGMRAQDVLCQPADDGEVLRGVVLSGTRLILAEHHVEAPVQLVF